MKFIPLSLLSILLLNSCNSSTVNNNTTSQHTDTNVTVNTPPIANQTSPHSSLSQKELDHINASNEAMIDYENEERLAKANISLRDSSIFAGGDINSDYRIFGYQQPDIHSKKMILISVFTSDVEGNPFQCPYGASYSLDNIDSIELRYMANEGSFIKAAVIINKKLADTIFIEKRWTEMADL